jgi:replicative DNA helicase
VTAELNWASPDEHPPLDDDYVPEWAARESAAKLNGTATLETLHREQIQRDRILGGGAFILDQPIDVPAVWRGAAGGGTAWAVGEGLMIVGPDGVGKTTIAQQLVLARIGLRERVLGMQLAQDARPVLYLALDRPAQIARSFGRMVTEEDRPTLDRRLIIWKGPPPFDIVKKPRALADFAELQGAGTVTVDSLKDLASKLSDDEVGGRVNEAFQEVLARGIELLCSHHQRKAQPGAGPPKKMADVYGSRWLTAGMGSVFMLWGDAGDLEVECLHLKQPDEELGPWKLLHDHRAGRTVIVDQVNLLEFVTARGPDGVTAEQAAALMFDSTTPARNDVEKARRRLQGLTDQGHLSRTGAKPDPVIYRRKQT